MEDIKFWKEEPLNLLLRTRWTTTPAGVTTTSATVGLNVGLARDRGGFLLTENNKARTDEVKMKPQPPQGPGMRILRKLCPTCRGSRGVTAQ